MQFLERTKALQPIGRSIIDRCHLWPLVDKLHHRDLHFDVSQFIGFQAPLQQLMLRAARTYFYRRSEQAEIQGFMSPKERQMLYALARWLPGPIVEIGSWCGLSTTAIARGIRDSKQIKSFNTYDLLVTPDNFRPVDGGIGLFLDGDDVPHGVCTEDLYRRYILPILISPGSSQGILIDHLERLGLAKFVKVNIGDFRKFTPTVAGFVFCDALHDLHEISINAPALHGFLKPGSVLACHDIGNRPNLITAVREILPLGHSVAIKSLYIAEVV